MALSRDHKPTLKDERARIEAAGGFVEYKRVNGNLALSRALGDFMFKRNDRKSPQEQIVTGKDEILNEIRIVKLAFDTCCIYFIKNYKTHSLS